MGMRAVIWTLILSSLMSSAAIFGFFYAWVCSTMWGLDAADPRVAIAAMQAMNSSVRNVVFAPAFFGTPVLLAVTGGMLWGQRHPRSAALFGVSSVVYLALGLVLTMAVNVPMNQALATVTVPADVEAARAIWLEYSSTWQVWNQIRTAASGGSLLFAMIGAIMFAQAARSGSTIG